MPNIDLTNPRPDISGLVQMPQPEAPKKRRGMFGGAGKFLQSFLVNLSASRGNPAAQNWLQDRSQRQEAEQRQAYAEEQYQRHRQDGMQDWISKETWTRTHPDAPDIVQRIQALDGIQPGLGKTYAQNYAQNGGGLGTIFKDPATGQQYMPQQMPPLGVEMDDPRKTGGPQGSPLSGPFPNFGQYPRY